MQTLYHAVVPTLWAIWAIYWVVAAVGAKPTARHESAASRASHIVPLILGAAAMGAPRLLGAGLAQPFHPRAAAWFWSGVALLALGLGFSIAARAWLGRNWSGAVTLKQDHELIRSGPYAIVRHPIYTGLLLALIGSVLVVDRWSALIGLALIAAALVRKLTIEERFMSEQFGEAYALYRAEVPALVPFLV